MLQYSMATKQQIMFILIGLLGLLSHNLMANLFSYFSINLLIANCLGFLFANQITYWGHTSLTFQISKNFKLRYTYLTISFAFLILSNLLVYIFHYYLSLEAWQSFGLATFLIATINFLTLKKLFAK